MNIEKALIILSACAVNSVDPDPQIISSIDLDALYEIACEHQLSAVVAIALKSGGLYDPRFEQERAKAIRKTLIFDRERKDILIALERAKIWYMPLKGVILKDYYPQMGMRQMSDNDILVDALRADDVHEIMTRLGYSTAIYDSGHRDDYRKPPVSHFEMHRILFSEENGEEFYKYYRDVKTRLVKDKENNYGFHFTHEDFYIYMIAHEYKHYIWAGTGIRSLLDTYVFLQRYNDLLDWKYLKDEFNKLNIADFEIQNRMLSLALFNVGQKDSLSEKQEKMFQYYFTSGAYGTKEHVVQNIIMKSGKLKYAFGQIFPPMKAIKEHYPLFYKHKILIPLLPLYRLIHRWESVKEIIRIMKTC